MTADFKIKLDVMRTKTKPFTGDKTPLTLSGPDNGHLSSQTWILEHPGSSDVLTSELSQECKHAKAHTDKKGSAYKQLQKDVIKS